MTLAKHPVRISIPPFSIDGTLTLPDHPRGIVLFAQGSAASRVGWRDRAIVEVLHRGHVGTAVLDLIGREEGEVDEDTHLEWFDIHLLAGRLVIATDWLGQQAETRDLPLGYLGAGDGASVAMTAASARSLVVRAVVLRSGRPDLIAAALTTVATPTLFIVGGEKHALLPSNQRALEMLAATDKQLRIIPGSELAQTAQVTREWFTTYLPPIRPSRSRAIDPSVEARGRNQIR